MSGKEVTGFRPGSKSWKQFMAKLYGIGAAVVIVGAMFKIQHWPGAGPMLIVGLSVEAFIFFFSAFEPPHEDPDWSLVYPELAAVDDFDHDEEFDGHDDHHHAVGGGTSLTHQLDEMLEEAKIEPELLESLGAGLRSLGDQTAKMNNMADVSAVTADFTKSVQGATASAEELTKSYGKASESLSSFSTSSEGTQAYTEQMDKMSKNLAELNAMYEMQLKGAGSSMEATNQLYEGMGELMKNLHDSIEDTKRYKENISELSENLASLNTIYGNMLGAMQFNKPA